MQAIAKLDEIPLRGLVFRYKDGPFDEEGILVRLGGDGVRAYKNECRHLPMPLDDRDPRDFWDDRVELLTCNSHGARYRPPRVWWCLPATPTAHATDRPTGCASPDHARDRTSRRFR